MNWYYCSKCNAITQRDSEKKRIKSMCDTTGKNIFLTRIDNTNELAIKLRKTFLKNHLELFSFSYKERIFLSIAFEQGVMVVFNGINRLK